MRKTHERNNENAAYFTPNEDTYNKQKATHRKRRVSDRSPGGLPQELSAEVLLFL
jgi:hypothetical protein